MATLYDVLGVAPDASDAELRRAYHRAAMRLHPDRNPAADARAMRALNAAWAVLGSPERRRSYDRTLLAAPAGDGGRGGDEEWPGDGEWSGEWSGHADAGPLLRTASRVLRPSVVIVAVLALIFTVTAYAGPHVTSRSPAGPVTTLSTDAGSGAGTAPPGAGAAVPAGGALTGRCLRTAPGYDAVVACAGPNDGLVVAAAPTAAGCPGGTRPHLLADRTGVVCLAASAP